MEETEDPTEKLREELHEEAVHVGSRWVMGVALSSALLAACAAVTSLLSGHHANEAVVEQIRASDEWNFFQAKGIKATIVDTQREMLEAMGKKQPPEDEAKAKEYARDQEEIKHEAETAQASAESHLRQHVVFSRSVTLFQVAIAIGAIAVLTRKRAFWFVSLVFGVLGIAFLIQGLIIR